MNRKSSLTMFDGESRYHPLAKLRLKLRFLSHAGEIILKVVYGHTDDHHINLAEKAVKSLSESIAHGSFLVDFVPTLSHIPCLLHDSLV